MGSLLLPDGPLHVACVGAHPDDLEIALGGTLLQLSRREGVSVSSVTMTGSSERQREAEQAAEAFVPGSSTLFHDLPDGRLPEHWGTVKQLLEDFGAGSPTPDVVMAPRVDDAHQDHRVLGQLAPTVWRSALVLHYEIPKWDGDMGRPNTYVPVEPELAERKFQLLDEHYGSQRGRDWWDRELFLGFMRVRGMECRARYAEAFVVAKSVLDVTPRS